VKVKVNTLMDGQWALIATCLSSLLAYCNKSPTVILLYRKLLRFLAIQVKLVILAGAFVAGSTL